MANPIVVTLQSRGADKVARDADRIADRYSNMGSRVRRGAQVAARAAKAAVAAVAVGAVALAGSSVKAASDAEQSLGATRTVFGKYAADVIKRSKQAAKQVGLSANEYRELANVTGASLKGAGLPLEKVSSLTGKLNERAADLAATFGGKTSEAVSAFASLLRGEADPIERYGISVKQADVNARLAAKGQDKLTGAARKQAEIQARLDLAFKQSQDSAGAFSRESDTLAHKQQVLGAQVENIKVRIGNFLLPILSQFVGLVSDKVVPAVQRFIDGMKDGTGAGGDFAEILRKTWEITKRVAAVTADVVGFLLEHKGAVIALTATIVALVAIQKIHAAVMAVQAAGGLVALIKGTKTVTAVTKTWTAVQWLMNAALSANPIGLAVAALALLVAGVVLAYKKSETFRDIVKRALEAVGDAFRWLWNNVAQPVFKFLIGAIAAAMDKFADFVRALSKVPGFGWLKPIAEDMERNADKTEKFAESLRKIPDRKSVTVDVRVNTSAIDKVEQQLNRLGGARARTLPRTTARAMDLATDVSVTSPPIRVELRLSADELDRLARGRDLLLDVDLAQRVGIRRYAS